MKSDKDFRNFLSAGAGPKLVGIIVLGVLLLMLTGRGNNINNATRDEQSRAAEMCAMMEGVGECRVMMTYSDNEVFAVLVLCEGAESVYVREKIISAFSSLYGIGANRIEIQKLTK